MSSAYSPTKEDLELIRQAREAFAQDPSYLEQILWEARRRNKSKA